MKKFIHIISVLIATTLIFSFGACKYQVIPEPSAIDRNGTNIDPSDGILPPEKVSASNGNYRSIELNWSPVKNAIQYQIFSALTPYDNFIQIAETTGKETSITIDEDVGITNYYMVKAVNYYGTVSKGSKIVSGSTMDIPIITEIETSADGSSVTINWWMGNCTPETYAADIQFVISCFDTNKQKISGVEQTANGTADSVTITGLSAKTEYYFTVEAVNLKNTAQKTEKSDFTTTTTAHRIYPDKPLNLEITKGTDSSKVVLSWNLPQAADYYDKKTMIYSTHPVYFKIERKEKDADDSTYETIADYIGCVIDEGNTTGKKIKFDCATGTTSNSKVSITKSTEENAVTDEIYTNYTSLSKITYEDASAVKGKQYTYKVQSYTDDTKEQITDKSSIATEDGWKLSEIKFRAVSNPDDRIIENDKITAINVNFNLEFNDFDCDYTYVTTYERTNLRTSEKDPEAILFYTNNKSELDNKIYTFRDTETESVQGYYTYKLYIIAPTENEITAIPSEHYEAISSKGKVTVINEASLIPSITNFSIQDGYSNKFLLKWDEVTDENDDIVYTINWTELSGEEPVENTIDLTPDEYTVADGVVTFEHEALSGDIRKYTLDITKQGIPASEEYETICHTLGTPSPVMETYDYQNVTVTWPKVDMATKYEVSAYYENDETKTNIAVTPKFTTDERTGAIICTINKIDGYDDITKSGLPINFTVNAINENVAEANSTDNAITVKTLGPALVNTKAETQSIFTDYLKMSWDKVDGATGYIIYRTKYKYNADCTDWIFDKADYYFYDATDSNLSLVLRGEEAGEIPAKRAKITVQNNKYVLQDYYFNQEDTTSAYEENQEQIILGNPYGYVVVPVKNSPKDFMFGSDSSYLAIDSGDSGVVYNSNFADLKTSTTGYGLNVKSSKAEHEKTVTVKWETPYRTGNLTPYIFRRQKGSSTWISLGSANSATDTEFSDTLDNADKTKAYYYAVQYLSTNGSLNYVQPYEKQQRKIDDRYADNITTEELNKGYLYYIDFKASYNGKKGPSGEYEKDTNYYSEKITHTIWDFEERARGPENYTIYAKNLNTTLGFEELNETGVKKAKSPDDVDYGYVKVAAIDVNQETGNETFSLNATSDILNEKIITDVNGKNSYTGDTKVLNNASDLILYPIGITENGKLSTDGIMKVLRSSKTFYKLYSKREFTLNGVTKSVEMNQETYGYRQITDDELAKCVGLIIADTLYQAGIPKSGAISWEASYCSHKGGTFTLSHKAWDNFSQWGFGSTGYTHLYEAGTSSKFTESYMSEFNFKAGNSAGNSKGIKDNTLYYLEPLSISLEHESMLESMNCNIEFSAGAAGTSTSWTLSIKKDGQSIPLIPVYTKDKNGNTTSTVDTQATFLSYFPYDIGTKHVSADKTVNPNLQTYKNNWWN